MNILFDLYQQGKIAEASITAESAKDATKRLQSEVDDLRRKTDSLTIACQALWELLRSQCQWTDEIILQKMTEIDLRDGQLDGKIGSAPVTCDRCGRKTSNRRKTCLYCGEKISEGHIFQKV